MLKYPSESKDLASDFPDKVIVLKSKLWGWRESLGVQKPLPSKSPDKNWSSLEGHYSCIRMVTAASGVLVKV